MRQTIPSCTIRYILSVHFFPGVLQISKTAIHGIRSSIASYLHRTAAVRVIPPKKTVILLGAWIYWINIRIVKQRKNT